MKKTLLALIAATSTLSGLAYADSPYLGLSVVGAPYKFPLHGTTDSDNRSGWEGGGTVFAGYDIDKNWAVEGGYTYFGSQNYSYTNRFTGVPGNIETDSHVFYLAAKYTYPIDSQWGVYGKLGATNNHDGVSGTGDAAGVYNTSSNTGVYASVGGQYAVNRNVSVQAGYEYYGNNPTFGRRQNAVSLGVRYNF